MDDWEYENDKDDYGDIYNNGDDDYIPYHDYHNYNGAVADIDVGGIY